MLFFCVILTEKQNASRAISGYQGIFRDITGYHGTHHFKSKVLPENVRTFADGNETNKFSQETEKRVFIFKSPERDLTIGDVAHARHTENKLSSVLA